MTCICEYPASRKKQQRYLNCRDRRLTATLIACTYRFALAGMALMYTVFQKSDAKIQITITTAYLIRINYPLSGFNYHLSDVNVANFNKIHRTVSEQQLF